MDQDKKKRLVERIAKLFRLGDADRNDSESEVLLAATKARQLMAEHDISMADLDLLGNTAQANEIRYRIIRATAYVRKGSSFAVYDSHIAAAVDSVCGTRNIITTFRDFMGHKVQVSREFAGTEVDTAVAVELFHVLLVTCRRMARNRFGKKWTNSHTSYMEGIGSKISDRARQANAPLYTQHQALMVIDKKKRDAISTFLESDGIRKGKELKSQTRDVAAYYLGRKDGETVDFQAKMRVAGKA